MEDPNGEHISEINFPPICYQWVFKDLVRMPLLSDIQSFPYIMFCLLAVQKPPSQWP